MPPPQLKNIDKVKSKDKFHLLVGRSSPTVACFFASWANQCAPIEDAMTILAEELPEVLFLHVEAEESPDIAIEFEVMAVPTVLLFRSGKLLNRLEGSKAAEVSKAVKDLAKDARDRVADPSSSLSSTPRNDRMAARSPSSPTVAAPPQWSQTTRDHEDPQALKKRLKGLVSLHKVMVFMKGDASAPKCGFSKQLIEILKETGVEYKTFDILKDEEVRQGLKTYSNWPTYPQLYVNGELIGGLDIVKEMAESKDLQSVLAPPPPPPSTQPSSSTKVGGEDHHLLASITEDKVDDEQQQKKKAAALEEKLRGLINLHRVMVFMKGSPDEPKCGFSRTLVEILRETKVQFKTFDILTDEEVRQGLKTFSNWPTYPQVYVKGELVGGLDIIKELKGSGELLQTLKGA